MAAENVYVFDACAVIALLHQEEGAAVVEGLLKEKGRRCLLHVVNACEVYYDMYRRVGKDGADSIQRILLKYGFAFDDSLTEDFWKNVGELKALRRRVSLADCFALALAIREGAILVTSDHHEFDAIAEAKLCEVRFIR